MREEVKVALDEIDSAYELMGGANKEKLKYINSWVRKQKEALKEAGYSGKVPRQPRSK